MQVMIITAVAVGFFAYLANRQYNHAFAVNPVTGKQGSKKLTSYYLFATICIIILASVGGLRYYVGTDYGAYYHGYAKYAESVIERIQTWDEPGIAIIAKIVSLVYDDPGAFMFACTAITVFLFGFTLARHTDDFFFVIMLYILTSCWSGCFNGVRQYLAAAILFAGHRLIYERKFIKFCIVVFLAASFHVTALIMLPMYFLITEKLDIKKIVFIMASGVALVFSYDFLFELVGVLKDTEASFTDSAYHQEQINPLRILIALSPVLLYFFLVLQKRTFSGEENFYMGFIFVRASTMIATFNSAYLNRAGIYFEAYTALSLLFLVNKFDKNQKLIVKATVLILYGFLWFWFLITGSLNWYWVFDRASVY